MNERADAVRDRHRGSEWIETSLGHVIELRRGYDLPAAARKAGSVPVVSSSGITDYHSESKMPGPGVVTGRYGTIGRVFYIQGEYWPLNTALYVSDFRGNDPRFISYLLTRVNFSTYSDKSTVPGLNRNHLHQETVRIPKSVSEQRVVSHVLGSLDDKIDLNRRMSNTLAAMAGALFKSWFVDFEPVRAKMEGRDTGLPAHIADLFPDRLRGSALGMSPAGWEVVELGDCVEIVRGLSYKGSGLSADGLPMHNLNSIHEGGGYKEAGIKFYRGDYRARHAIRPGELIVANTEQGHDRRLIGYSAVVPSYFGQAGLFSHHLYRLELKGGRRLSPDYLCELLNAPGMQRMVSGYATGTTVNMLPSDALQRPPVSIPPAPLMELFRKLAADLRTRREALVRECRALAAARDELLPRLVSGSLRATGQISQRGVSGTGSERPLSDAPRANTYR